MVTLLLMTNKLFLLGLVGSGDGDVFVVLMFLLVVTFVLMLVVTDASN